MGLTLAGKSGDTYLLGLLVGCAVGEKAQCDRRVGRYDGNQGDGYGALCEPMEMLPPSRYARREFRVKGFSGGQFGRLKYGSVGMRVAEGVRGGEQEPERQLWNEFVRARGNFLFGHVEVVS